MSERMYNNSNYVSSQLITGTQWDVMLNYISNEEDKSVENAKDESKYLDLKTGCDWGNSLGTPLKHCEGKYCEIDKTSNSIITLWEKNTSGTNKNTSNEDDTDNIDNICNLLTTGSTEEVKRKNLYDVAGNLIEFVRNDIGSIKFRLDTAKDEVNLRRGSVFDSSISSNVTVCYRHAPETDEVAHLSSGFRVTLNIN